MVTIFIVTGLELRGRIGLPLPWDSTLLSTLMRAANRSGLAVKLCSVLSSVFNFWLVFTVSRSSTRLMCLHPPAMILHLAVRPYGRSVHWVQSDTMLAESVR